MWHRKLWHRKHRPLVLLWLVAIAAPAHPQGYLAGFESPTYSLGPLEGQAIWENFHGPNAPHTQVVNTQNHTLGGSRSVELRDGGDSLADFDALPGGSFDSGRWNLSMWTLVPVGSVGIHHVQVMNRWHLGGPFEFNAWVELDTSLGVVQAHTIDGLFPTSLVFGEWKELRFEYDLDTHHVDIYYNDVFLHGYDPRCSTVGDCSFPHSTSAIDGVDLFPDSWAVPAPSPIFVDDLSVVPGRPREVGSPYCLGDGSGAACPCGNLGGNGEGCANSSGPGARLDAAGSASRSADDAVFSGHQLLPGQPALLFFGDATTGGGSGVSFGDGLRCASTNVVRRETRTPNASGEADWGPGLLAGTTVAAGDTRYWQLWYRDPSGGGACGSSFNLTNGLALTYAP